MSVQRKKELNDWESECVRLLLLFIILTDSRSPAKQYTKQNKLTQVMGLSSDRITQQFFLFRDQYNKTFLP